jgi:hypothetical protein
VFAGCVEPLVTGRDAALAVVCGTSEDADACNGGCPFSAAVCDNCVIGTRESEDGMALLVAVLLPPNGEVDELLAFRWEEKQQP